MDYLFKTYSPEKLYGKVYTPSFIVKTILDEAGYKGENIIGKYILEPSCGNGSFLKEIVERICLFSNRENIDKNLKYVYAFDIDEQAIEEAKNSLNRIVKSFFPDLDNFEWNIFKFNALHLVDFLNVLGYEKVLNLPSFDYIVGNPPYVRIQHLKPKERVYLQTHFKFCKKGSTDLFIAFFELAWNLLKPDGICGYITPNTYFYTETAQTLRNFLVKNKALIKIIDFNDLQLFKNKSTYSAITIFGKQKRNIFVYQFYENEKKFYEKTIEIASLNNSKRWVFNFTASNRDSSKMVRLSNIASIHTGLTTLCDKFYILDFHHQIDEKLSLVYSRISGFITIENDILKPILKASRPSKWDTKKEMIIFPYSEIDNKMEIIPEDILNDKFPKAYSYFLAHKELLLQRDRAKPNPVAWYAFGRNQNLKNSFGEKIIFSNIMKVPNFIYVAEPKFTFYSGYCIKLNTDIISYEELLQQLNSERMHNFVLSRSRSFRDGWKAYSKKVLEDFEIYLP